MVRRLGKARTSIIFCIIVPAVAAFSAPVLHAADERAATISTPLPPATAASGYLSLRYFYRTADSSGAHSSDQDVFTDLRMDVVRPRDNRFEFHFLGTARSDLDGNQDVKEFSPLEDIGDTWGHRIKAQVLEANAVLNDPLTLTKRITIGRQAGTRDEPVVFDGIAAEFGTDALLLSLYGGAAAHFFEVDSHWGKDTLEGAGIDYRPLPSLGVSADLIAVKDLREFDPNKQTVHDRMVSFRAWQRFEPFTSISAKYRYLDGEPRDLAVNAAAAWMEQDAEMSVNYFRQFNPQRELSNDLSLFYDVIGVSAPYQSIDIKVRKSFASRYAFDAGYFKRSLLEHADQGPFNKEYSREYIDAEISDLFLPNLSGMITAEWWKAGGTSFSTLGADLTYRIRKGGRESRLGAGTYYSMYKYDNYAAMGVRDQVRTYYLEGKYPLGKGLSANGRYEFEHGIDRDQMLRLGMRYDF